MACPGVADASAVDDALRRWSEAQLQVAAQVMPIAERLERSQVFEMPDLTTMPTTATNDWVSAAYPGIPVTLPDGGDREKAAAKSFAASFRQTGCGAERSISRYTGYVAGRGTSTQPRGGGMLTTGAVPP
jgi:hypothetical protein